MSGEVGRLTELVLTGIPVLVQGDPTINWVSDPPATTVTARGPAARLANLSRGDIEALVQPRGDGEEETVAVSVSGPAGLEFEASTDSAVVRSRDGA